MSDNTTFNGTVLSDEQIDQVSGGINSEWLNINAIPLFKQGMNAFDVYTVLVQREVITEDEEIEDSDLTISEYLNELMDTWMD